MEWVPSLTDAQWMHIRFSIGFILGQALVFGGFALWYLRQQRRTEHNTHA